MFGWLIKNEVNDDAVRLKTLADMAASKYCRLSFKDACVAVKGDFNDQQRYVDHNSCTFVFEDFPDFQFSLDHFPVDGALSLSAHGRGKYAGCMLQTTDGGANWHGSVSDGIAYRATGGAKKMMELLEKKFGVRDHGKMLARLGIKR